VAASESTRKVGKALMQYFFLQQPAVACLTVAGPTACLPFFCRSRIFFYNPIFVRPSCLFLIFTIHLKNKFDGGGKQGDQMRL
jgi:hypothetical protein